MLDIPNPRQILETLLPHLKVAAAYAQQIQHGIANHPDKYDSDNFFANALTDADLSIQTFVEVALLAHFPQIRFHGEEYEKSYNTKYFRAIDLGPQGDYLVTLDPIDGTQFYMDGHANYQIILTILNADQFEAVLAMSPAQQIYYYALRDQGTFVGRLRDRLEDCQRLTVETPKNNVLLGWDMGYLAEHLPEPYHAISVQTDYSQTAQIPNVNGLLTGDLAGAILARGKFIDGAALAFMAREMGYWVTAHDGSALPPLYACRDYEWPGLVIGASPTVHQDLVAAIRNA
ncbi:MAG: inositol monophosphatase family protein [Leptolyngbya sp. SIO4C1]|nr:inositol monophosphatase family protein [Leptolyngbya sp. SIO4C1]